MNYTIILRPLIGAGIGYVTNWIAVKMLFRPLKPIKIGKFSLPFTPGIIPKNQGRLAESIGQAISENLLTENDLKNALLSDEMLQEIREKVVLQLNKLSENDLTFQKFTLQFIDEVPYNKALENIKEYISSSIYDTVKEYNLGKLIAEQIELSAKEKMKGSLIGLFGGNSIVSTISETATLKINDYINTNGKEIITNMVTSEINKYTETKISDITVNLANSNIDVISIVMKIYKNFIIEKVPQILTALNISKIIENKINSMDVLELEKLILNIMKKELNALVNLGAIIGFILGLLNLLF